MLRVKFNYQVVIRDPEVILELALRAQAAPTDVSIEQLPSKWVLDRSYIKSMKSKKLKNIEKIVSSQIAALMSTYKTQEVRLVNSVAL